MHEPMYKFMTLATVGLLTDEMKMFLFQSYCTSMHCCQFWLTQLKMVCSKE